MATTTIPWGDGSGDNIYLTYPSASGDQTVDVSSDANTGAARSKVVTFTSGVGNIIQTLTISQVTGIPPIYELASPTAVQEYDTGIKLFDTPKSFTILCRAKFNNYYWNNSNWTAGIFGISTGNNFKFGSINNGKDYRSDELFATANRYSAIIMNSTASNKRCSAIIARSNSMTERKIFVTYDHTTRIVKVGTASNVSTTIYWYTVPADLSSDNTIKLNLGYAATRCTVNAFKIYDRVLTDAQIESLISSL